VVKDYQGRLAARFIHPKVISLRNALFHSASNILQRNTTSSALLEEKWKSSCLSAISYQSWTKRLKKSLHDRTQDREDFLAYSQGLPSSSLSGLFGLAHLWQTTNQRSVSESIRGKWCIILLLPENIIWVVSQNIISWPVVLGSENNGCKDCLSINLDGKFL